MTDGEWLSTVVEGERFTRNVFNTTGVAVGPLHDQVPLPRLEKDDRSSGAHATTGESAPKLGARLDASSGLTGGNMQTSEAHCCNDTEAATEVSTPAPGNALPKLRRVIRATWPLN